MLLTALAALSILLGCANEPADGGKKSIEDYKRSKVGVMTGSYQATLADKIFPEATVLEYNTVADLFYALMEKKIDISIVDASSYTCAKWEGLPLARLDEVAETSQYGIIFPKGQHQELRLQINEFLKKIREDGTYDKLYEKWFDGKEPTEFLDPATLTGTNGTLKVVSNEEIKPFGYIKNGRHVGYDMDILVSFAEEYGYKLDITTVPFQSLLAGVSSGSYQMGISGLTITEERKETFDFSESYHNEDIIYVISGKNAGHDSLSEADMASGASVASGFENFFASVGESFEKTFIRESRWKLIVKGVLNTLMLSVCSVLGGTLLGFLLYLAARSKNKILSAVTRVLARIYSRLITGTPTLVVLMLLFYVAFSGTNLNEMTVAIIGFILTFGSFVYAQLTLTVEAVDKGQTEAAYALGYSRNQTFFRIVFPQAMNMFLPAYSSEIVGLIKATSIVGYIAVNDLTKMGDIIRGNTYEAFFPLIAVAVIYFMITWGTIALLGILKRKTEPKRRKNKNILKGVAR